MPMLMTSGTGRLPRKARTPQPTLLDLDGRRKALGILASNVAKPTLRVSLMDDTKRACHFERETRALRQPFR